MANRHCESVGGIRLGDRTTRQDLPHHHLDLGLVRVPGADDRFLDQIGRVFGNREAALGRCEQDHAAGDAEFQGRRRVAVDEALFDRRLIRAKAFEHRRDLPEQ